MLLHLELPNFAKWRWRTLEFVCNKLVTVYTSLRDVFDRGAFKKSKDQTLFSKVVEALTEAMFGSFLLFINWFCQWLGRIASWIGGCECHVEEFARGEKVHCNFVGRRLESAYPYATNSLKAGIAVAESWARGTFGFPFDMVVTLQGCVRSIVVVGFKKLEYLDVIPLLAARLRVPGVRQRCLDQYAAAPRPDSVSDYLFHPDSTLRGHVERVADDGSGVSVELGAEIRSLLMISLDDTLGERPHAVANAIGQRSRRASWPWIAGTMRLTQNLSDVTDLCQAVGADLQVEWDLFKTVVQPAGGRSESRPKRSDRNNFDRIVYHMGANRSEHREAHPAVKDDVDMHGDGGPAPVHAAPAAPVVAVAAVPGTDPPILPAVGAVTEAEFMIREFCASALKKYSFFSLPSTSGPLRANIVFLFHLFGDHPFPQPVTVSPPSWDRVGVGWRGHFPL